MLSTNLLIVGAGPFGLALAAYAQRRNMDYIVVGKPMEFWENQMPAGMFLRSGPDWHLDPDGEFTIERYAAERNESVDDIVPISLEWYLGYCQWFIAQTHPHINSQYVTKLDRNSDGFMATLTDGTIIRVEQVVLATGFGYFTHSPAEIISLLPAGRFLHTCEAINLSAYQGKRVLLLGGRQSAFEWAALLSEAGATSVHLSYRHDSPGFIEADWSWVAGLVDRIVEEPAWFRRLSETEKDQYRHQLWAEGRLKVEPWLADRLSPSIVSLHPRTRLEHSSLNDDGAIVIQLDSGEAFEVDEVILATGYLVNISRLPFLSPDLLNQIDQEKGFPKLDTTFQSSVPGLYFTSFPAGNDFGPFFGFTIAVRAAAQVIGRAVQDLPIQQN